MSALKRIIRCYLAILPILLLISCGHTETTSNNKGMNYTTENITTSENTPTLDLSIDFAMLENDSAELEDVLTVEYDLQDLKDFFDGYNRNDGMIFDEKHSALSFAEVHQKFPIEVLRSNNYSVYKVSQGGYFYVFWVDTFEPESYINGIPVTSLDDKFVDKMLYFSAYLPSATMNHSFSTLVRGVSTAEDVYQIDPAFELCFLLSSGTYSYSYLDEDNILRIEYSHKDMFEGYDDLIVKKIEVIPRSTAASRFCTILSKDLP